MYVCVQCCYLKVQVQRTRLAEFLSVFSFFFRFFSFFQFFLNRDFWVRLNKNTKNLFKTSFFIYFASVLSRMISRVISSIRDLKIFWCLVFVISELKTSTFKPNHCVLWRESMLKHRAFRINGSNCGRKIWIYDLTIKTVNQVKKRCGCYQKEKNAQEMVTNCGFRKV